MGITIHYKGKLDNAENIESFVNELSDISTELGWEYQIIDDGKKQLAGISLNPHKECETLLFIFDNKGNLRSIGHLLFDNFDDKYTYWVSTKTQYAPLEVHVAIINLLKYIKSKYISDLEVVDEADYWDTMDKNVLKEKMDFLASKIDLIGDVLDSSQDELSSASSTEELIQKLEAIFKKMGFNLEK